VFPQLYLPVMEEANVRVLRPHRKYLPTPSWFRFRRNMAALNAYLVGVIRARWAERLAGRAPEGGDILDRILAAIEVRGARRRRRRLLVFRGKRHTGAAWGCRGWLVLGRSPGRRVCRARRRPAQHPHLGAEPHRQNPANRTSPQAAGTKWDGALETQLCYELKTFLLAGHETSAAMLMWSVFELSQNEAACKKVRGSETAAGLMRRNEAAAVWCRGGSRGAMRRLLCWSDGTAQPGRQASAACVHDQHHVSAAPHPTRCNRSRRRRQRPLAAATRRPPAAPRMR
jgi:hypothetical protein